MFSLPTVCHVHTLITFKPLHCLFSVNKWLLGTDIVFMYKKVYYCKFERALKYLAFVDYLITHYSMAFGKTAKFNRLVYDLPLK